MSTYLKAGGQWVEAEQMYLKQGEVWRPLIGVYRKVGSVWKQTFEFDITPPPVPLVSVELIETTYWDDKDKKTGRHLKVGVRGPGGSHDTNLKRIRVLTTYFSKPPTTQYGGTFVTKPDDDFPDEPWSDFSYNGYNESKLTKDSSIWRYKEYPPNAGAAADLEVRTYHFTAWAEDLNGNWSAANAATIDVPKKGKDGGEEITKEARFMANGNGSITSDGYTAGVMRQQANPTSRGIWFYHNQIAGNIGSQGAATIKSAQIFIHRRQDTGKDAANVYMHWHQYAQSGDLPVPGSVDRKNMTKLGTIGQGESKWFDIPEVMKTAMEARTLKGFGVNHKDQSKPEATANDFSVFKSIDDAPRCGEVHVVWTEKPA